jgi:inosine/xanthosine triphosphate pyrophosphatase family protein
VGSPKRPSPRPSFMTAARKLAVYFYTSNLEKYLQAKSVFEQYGLVLHHWRTHTEPYHEREELTSAELLTLAIDELQGVVGASRLFFIEDTSLRLDALSTATSDFPGLKVKQWFGATTFAELDRELQTRGNNRRATIRSDIALHVPGLIDPVFFHGGVEGEVASTPPTFATNPQHPWLTPHTFNGWFVPAGAVRRLGEMTFDEAWNFDFRVRSLVQVVDRLEQFAAILNAVREVSLPSPTTSGNPRAKSLFPPRVVVVVGAACAGKTTFGEMVTASESGPVHVEASAVMRSFMRDSDHGKIKPSVFAHQLMRERGADTVARRAIELYGIGEGSEVVITGLRTIEEWLAVLEVAPAATMVLITASPRTRYARFILRPRGEETDLATFQRVDGEQTAFGLLRIASDLCHVTLENEHDLATYKAQVLHVLNETETPPPGVARTRAPRDPLVANRLYRCLAILAREGRPMQCDEIEARTIEQGVASTTTTWSKRYTGKQIPQNNVNKVLKAVPELATRTEHDGGRLTYDITAAGRAYLRAMDFRWKSGV